MPSNDLFVKELPAMCLRDSNDAIYFLTETENHLCVCVFIGQITPRQLGLDGDAILIADVIEAVDLIIYLILQLHQTSLFTG